MSVKFSEDVVPLTDLKVNPGRVVRQAAEAHRPVLLTSRGRGVAVVQSVADFERDADEREFMRAVVAGLADLEAGRELSLAEAKARLGLTSKRMAEIWIGLAQSRRQRPGGHSGVVPRSRSPRGRRAAHPGDL